MATSADTLLAETKCYACYGASLPQLLELGLLNQIAASSGGGGSGSVLSGVGAPVADPGVSAAIYFDTATGVQYNFYSGAWH